MARSSRNPKELIVSSKRATPPPGTFRSADVRMDFLKLTGKSSFCEWKGVASYWTVRVGDENRGECGLVLRISQSELHSHQRPSSLLSKPSECYVDDELVAAQPGDFYGGWITRELVGPFKGAAGYLGLVARATSRRNSIT